PGDMNGTTDVCVHDRLSGETGRVSVPAAGSSGEADGPSFEPAISEDGRVVAFISRATNLASPPDLDRNQVDDVFVHDRVSRETTRVSRPSGECEANGASGHPSLSADGSVVAFHSSATNLVSCVSRQLFGVYIRDRDRLETTLVSVTDDGAAIDGFSAFPTISGDGQRIVFETLAPDPQSGSTFKSFLHDRADGRTTPILGPPTNGENLPIPDPTI